MDPTLKGYTLGELEVNKYSYSQPTGGVDQDVGMKILEFVLIMGFLAALMLAPLLTVALIKTFSRTLGSDISKSNWSHSSSLIAGATVVSIMFCFMTWVAELNQLNKLVKINRFADMKLGFLATLYAWALVVTFAPIGVGIYCRSNSQEGNHSTALTSRWWIFVYVAVSTIVGFASHIILVLFPTVLFMFVHPVDISALIFLHVALIYSMTVILAIFMNQLYRWGACECNEKCHLCCVCCIWFLYLFYVCCMLISVPLTYITIIEIYQFIVGRNVYEQQAWTALANFIPSVVIVLFTRLLNKMYDDKSKDGQKEGERAPLIEK